jgi:hypothetical protein
MLTLEQYASIYLPMVTAAGNPEKEQELCADKGFTAAQWNEAKLFYTNKMMDPNDGGKTAMAFSAAMMQGASAPVQTKKHEPLPPQNFAADKVNVYVSEYDVQMIEFVNSSRQGQHVVIQMGFEFDEAQISFGGDRPHISINDQSYSIYGGVSRVTLSSTAVTFEFDEEGRERMMCDSVTVSLTINGKLYNYLKRKLKFIYGNLLIIKDEPVTTAYTVNGLVLNDEWTACRISNLDIKIRHDLQNIRQTGTYPYVFFVDFNSKTIGQNDAESSVLKAAEESLIDSMEYDLAAVMALHTTSDEKRRYFLYSYLRQDEFMNRINDAFRLLPQMPLDFSGGDDAAWTNYTECMKDVAKDS